MSIPLACVNRGGVNVSCEVMLEFLLITCHRWKDGCLAPLPRELYRQTTLRVFHWNDFVMRRRISPDHTMEEHHGAYGARVSLVRVVAASWSLGTQLKSHYDRITRTLFSCGRLRPPSHTSRTPNLQCHVHLIIGPRRGCSKRKSELDIRQCCLGGFTVVFFWLDIQGNVYPAVSPTSSTPTALSSPLGSFLSHPSGPLGPWSNSTDR